MCVCAPACFQRVRVRMVLCADSEVGMLTVFSSDVCAHAHTHTHTHPTHAHTQVFASVCRF